MIARDLPPGGPAAAETDAACQAVEQEIEALEEGTDEDEETARV